jgi:hypothetical protein
MTQRVYWAAPKYVWASLNTYWAGKWAIQGEKKRVDNSFVLPPIRTP